MTFSRLAPATLLLTVLAGCAATPERFPEADEGKPNLYVSPDAPATRLEEPRRNEVIIVINNNAITGNHAGMFVGLRLSDPAGSYKNTRSRSPGWQRPGLNDYVGFQMVDGQHIQTYRFTLQEADLSAIAARLPEADAALPLFCGSAVNNAIAGIGPFRDINRVTWTTPAAVAEQLDLIVRESHGAGTCFLPDGSDCRQESGAR